MSSRRIGILGGTFDPIHHGHLVVAENCWFQLDLDDVLFVPAGDPPHKRGRAISPAADRVAMIEAAIRGNPHFRLSRVDVDRPGASYSVDMIQALRAEYGPAVLFFFIIGNDSLVDLPSWRDPGVLLELCQVVAVNRPGYPRFDLSRLDPIVPNAHERIMLLEVPSFDVAASDIRARVADGRPIAYLVPDAVRQYVDEKGLYRERGMTLGVERGRSQKTESRSQKGSEGTADGSGSQISEDSGQTSSFPSPRGRG